MSRNRYLELVEKLPYQYIKDSPTVKYYTDWRVFDKALTLPSATRTEKPPVPIAGKANIVLGSSEYLVGNIPEDVVVESLGEEYKPGIRIESRIQAIHFARLSLALKIRIPPEIDIESPLVIVSKGGEGFLGHHIVLEAGRNSRVEIILVDYASGGGSVKTLVVEGHISENSRIKLSTILLHKDTAGYHYKHVSVGENTLIETRVLGLAGEMSHYREDYELSGEKSALELYGSIVSGNGRIDFITNTIHLAPRSRSNILVRGVVLSKGLLVHRGVARISPKAYWSSTSIDSFVTILSEEGRGYSVPMLEIQTGRVLEARHSTAVASIDEDQLFYLQSRGLDKRDSEKIILEGIVGYSGLLEALNTSLDEILNMLY